MRVRLFELRKHKAKVIHQVLDSPSRARKPDCVYAPALRIGRQDLLERLATNFPHQSGPAAIRSNHECVAAGATCGVFVLSDRSEAPTLYASLGNNHKAVVHGTTGRLGEERRQTGIVRRSVRIGSNATA